MEKKILSTSYKIATPSNGAYRSGTLSFMFDDNLPSVIKKIDFKIDNTNYSLNLIRVGGNHRVTWMFQKQGSLKAVSQEELCKILHLTQDVIKTYPMRPAYQKLLWALPEQAKIYSKFVDNATPKDEKRVLMKELCKKNNLLDNITSQRWKEFRDAGIADLIKQESIDRSLKK